MANFTYATELGNSSKSGFSLSLGSRNPSLDDDSDLARQRSLKTDKGGFVGPVESVLGQSCGGVPFGWATKTAILWSPTLLR